jgi:PAS domain S-box-containing protein
MHKLAFLETRKKSIKLGVESIYARIKFFRWVPSFFLISLGAIVMAGWLTHSDSLVQVLPEFAPMQFNTALCFFLTGSGLLFISGPWNAIAHICGFLVMLMGALTLIEYSFSVNTGLDTLFVKPYAFTDTFYPGRMAPNTALGFLLSGSALLFSKTDRRVFLGMASGIAVIAALSFLTYALGFTDIFGWDLLTRMAVHTTAGFFVVAFVLFLHSASRETKGTFNLWDAAPVLSFTVLIILTFFGWHVSKEIVRYDNRQHFLALIKDSESILKEKFSLYEQALYGGASLVLSSENVTKDEWGTYVSTLNIDDNLTGVYGIGIIDYVRSDKLHPYIQKNRENNLADFINHPETPFQEKFIIRYMEPMERNAAAIGLDIGFESNRRAAALKSIDAGMPVLSHKVRLVQDTKNRASFILLMPIYSGAAVPATVAERRKNITGWIYMPLVSNLFLQGLTSFTKNRISFTIYDGTELREDQVIYKQISGPEIADSDLRKTSALQFAGNVWTISWRATKSFVPQYNYLVPGVVLLCGFLLTGVLSGVFLLLSRIYGHTAQTLSESRERLRAVVEHAVDGLITIDQSGIIESYNPACERIFGYSVEETRGRNIKMLMPDPDKSRHDSYIANYLRTGEAKIIGIGREVTGQRKNGTKFSMELSISSFEIKGKPMFSGIIRDITERKRAEEEILRSNLELSRFAYIASHDLREPLRMVSSFTALLQEEYADRFDEQARQYMAYVISASNRMQDLINDLLEYSRAHAETEIHTNVDCNKSLTQAIDNLREGAAESSAKITYDELPEVYGNSAQITRLLQNLIGNAIKYRHRERAPEIHIGVKQHAGQWVFSVSDNGIGIKSEYLDQIFTIFTRLHNKNEYPGTGIGLAICRKISESLGGHIWAESEPGKGSTFYFTIPVKEEKRNAA